MGVPVDESLDEAYRATSYVVFGPEGRFALRVDRHEPALDRLLARHGLRTWAFVTACNPGSRPLSDEENRPRRAALERAAREAKCPSYPGEGVGDDGNWPPEPSLLILGLSPEGAAELGRRFGQNALLCGATGEAARLMWLSDEPGRGREA